MTILVLGGDGMLGHKMFDTLRKKFNPHVVCTVRGNVARANPLFTIKNIDCTDLDGLDRILVQWRPETVINCVGVIKQRPEANDAIQSVTINSLLPHRIANTISSWGGRLFHFSTDCVFSGKDGNYTEESTSDAEDLYGKSKFLGEVHTDNAVTLRTSIIGRELKGYLSLLEWFLAQNGKQVKGYTGAIYSGVTTNYISWLVGELIEKHPTLSGLYQVTSTPISKYDLLLKLRTAYNLNIDITPVDGECANRSMCGDKFISTTCIKTPSWDILVEQLSSDETKYVRG